MCVWGELVTRPFFKQMAQKKQKQKPKIATGRVHWQGKIKDKPTGVNDERRRKNK